MGLFGGLEASLKLNASDFSRGLRSAQSSTKTFGRVTESTFDDVGDEAGAMSRAVSRSRRGFGRLADTMRNTLIPARLLASQLDEVGDEADEAGDEAAGASRGFFLLSLSSSGLSFSLGVLSTVTGSTVFMLGLLLAALIPIIAVLAPLVIGVGALAAAFGLIVGTGIIAWGKGFQKTLKKVTKQIIPLVKEFGKKFIPFLKETLLMLPGLVKRMLDAVGGMDAFLNALRSLRDFAFKFLPKLIAWFFDVGRAVLPTLKDIGGFIIKYVVPAFLKLVRFGKQVIKFVRNLWREFQQATAKGTTLRKKFNQLRQALQQFWTKLQPVIDALGRLFTALRPVIPVVIGLAFDIGRLAVTIGTKLLPYLVIFIDFLTGLVKWFNKLSPGVKRLILLVGGLFLALGPVISILGTLFSALSTIVTIVGTVIAVFNPLTLAIIALGITIGGLAYLVYKHWNSIVTFTKNLAKSVTSWFDEMGTKIKQWGRDVLNWLSGDFILDFITWFVTLHVRVIDKVTQMLSDLFAFLTGRKGPASNLDSAGQALIEEFISGIKSKISDVIATVEGMLQSVRNRFPFSPAKYGPLSDIDKAGPALVETFARGIRSSTDIAVSAAENVARSVLSVFNQAKPQFGLFAGERSRISLKGLFKNMPGDLIADLLENFTEGRINVGQGFQPLSSVIGLKEYVRAARRYGFIERRNGQPVFHEDTAVVGIENVLNDEAIEFKVKIDTDDEALSAWVSNKADLIVNRNVRQALDQANRRGTFR